MVKKSKKFKKSDRNADFRALIKKFDRLTQEIEASMVKPSEARERSDAPSATKDVLADFVAFTEQEIARSKAIKERTQRLTENLEKKLAYLEAKYGHLPAIDWDE